MLRAKQLILFFFISTSLLILPMASIAAEIPQNPISITDPKALIPVGMDNGLSPDQPYVEYATEASPLREPVPFLESQCANGACHYPTNRWFTDLIFYSKVRNSAPENFAVVESPYAISVFDDSLIQTNPLGSYYDKLPGLAVSYNLPLLAVSADVQPYKYRLNGDMYRSHLYNDSTSHFVLTVPYQAAEDKFKPETTRQIVNYDQLGFATEWTLKSTKGTMTAQLVRGSPYITMEYKNLPVTLRTFQNNGLYAIAADNQEPKMLTPGMRATGKTFRFLLNVTDFSLKDKLKKDAPQILRFYEYVLFSSSPITLEFLPRKAPDPSFVFQTVNEKTGTPENFNGVIRVAYVGSGTANSPDEVVTQKLGFKALVERQFASTEKMLSEFANNYPIGVDLKLNTSGNSSSVVFEWKTKRMDGTAATVNDPVLMMAFEKNQMPYLTDVTKGDQTYRFQTLRGDMLPVIGSRWTLNVPISPELNNNNLLTGSKKIPDVLKPELQEALKADIAWLKKPEGYPRHNLAIGSRNDSYGFGKQIARIARLVIIADELGDTSSRDFALSKMKEAIGPWFPKAEPKDKYGAQQSYMRYDNKFGGTITARAAANPKSCPVDQCGYNLDYFNGQYTDHHFHYGYFLYAAAVIAKFDPAWLAQYKDAINLLARDIANPSTKDPYYPQYRHFDWFEGHAFANGLVPGGDGRNQESTSEGINGWYGLTLWGAISGNTDLANIGRIMTMLEARAAQDWEHITPGKSIYENYIALAGSEANPQSVDLKMGELIVTGINWSLKLDHTTFFGLVKSYLIGIQLMPYTPITNALISSDWIIGKINNEFMIKSAVDQLVNKIKYYQIVNDSPESIFGKFIAEWPQFSKTTKMNENEYWGLLAGRLNDAYQWGLNAMPAFALADADLTYRYTAFNTNGIFFNEMQKVNDAFYADALNKNGVVTLAGISVGRECSPPDKISYCFRYNSTQHDIGFPVALLGYGGMDKGETVTNLLWWDFINKGANAKPNAPALFWLFDDPITTDLTGTTANLSWQPAKIINGSGTIKYTVTIFGKTVCETEGTSCVLTQLKPETNYIAAITARDKDGKLISTVSSAPAYITSYLAFRTLSGQMTSYIEFPGPVTKTKIDDHSVSLSWQAAELCKAGDPKSCQINTNDIIYEVKSADYSQSLCTDTAETSCTLSNLDPNTTYSVWVLAKTKSNSAAQKNISFTFTVNDQPVGPKLTWTGNQVNGNGSLAQATITWSKATVGNNNDDAQIKYTVYATLNGNEGVACSTTGVATCTVNGPLVAGTYGLRVEAAFANLAPPAPLTGTLILQAPNLNWTGNAFSVAITGNMASFTWSQASIQNDPPHQNNEITYKVTTTNNTVFCEVHGVGTCQADISKLKPGNYPVSVIASLGQLITPPLTTTLTINQPITPTTPQVSDACRLGRTPVVVTFSQIDANRQFIIQYRSSTKTIDIPQVSHGAVKFLVNPQDANPNAVITAKYADDSTLSSPFTIRGPGTAPCTP